MSESHAAFAGESPYEPDQLVEMLEALREPFLPDQIDKLPKGIKKEGQASSCKVCGGWHKPASVHLDYVGHATTTGRLLDVDPFWSWEPFSFDDRGAPLLERDQAGNPIGLWIRLTVCGVTRIGYGSCEPGKTDPIKELIGDAIRNAAMRFGVALELWQKEHKNQSKPEPSVAKPTPVSGSLKSPPAATAQATNADTNIPAPEPVYVGTVDVESVTGHNPETTSTARATAAQWTVCRRRASEAGIEPDALPAIFNLRYGFSHELAGRQTATDFADWLKTRAAAAGAA